MGILGRETVSGVASRRRAKKELRRGGEEESEGETKDRSDMDDLERELKARLGM